MLDYLYNLSFLITVGMTNNVITLTDRQFAATIAAPVSVGILVSIAAFVVACMCVYFKNKRQRNEYGQVRGEGE